MDSTPICFCLPQFAAQTINEEKQQNRSFIKFLGCFEVSDPFKGLSYDGSSVIYWPRQSPEVCRPKCFLYMGLSKPHLSKQQSVDIRTRRKQLEAIRERK